MSNITGSCGPGRKYVSSYEPVEEDESGSSHDPGVKEGEVTDERELSSVVSEFNELEYVTIGLAATIPTALLTMVAVLELFPAYADVAAELLRQIGVDISKFAAAHPELFEPFEQVFEFFRNG